MKKSITYDEIQDALTGYTKLSTFKKDYPKHSARAYYMGWARELFSHLSKYNRNHTIESVQIEALKYKHRSDFFNNSRPEYKAAGKLDILDIVCSHMTKKKMGAIAYTDRELIDEALKHNTKMDFKHNGNAMYQVAGKRNMIDKICSHMTGLNTWSKEDVLKVAETCSTRTEFKTKYGGAYNYARTNNIYEEVMKDIPQSRIRGEYNIFYIWEAIGERWNDKPIFKIGVTSKRLGIERIERVAFTNNFEHKIHVLIESDIASYLESTLLNKFNDIPNISGEGATEFRAIEYEDIERLKALYV